MYVESHTEFCIHTYTYTSYTTYLALLDNHAQSINPYIAPSL